LSYQNKKKKKRMDGVEAEFKSVKLDDDDVVDAVDAERRFAYTYLACATIIQSTRRTCFSRKEREVRRG
jgi:hypothetical protein